uniref:NET domain-containing protein n=1 Tax=Oryza punctata TaxID=4537 RepID=A0A0E0L0W7_ORYPU
MAVLPCRRRLTDRIQSERRVVGGLLKKAEALVAHHAEDAHGGKKSGRFLRPEAATAIDGAASPHKKRKTTVTSPIVEVEVEAIEPTMPKAQRDRLYGLISSLTADMPLPPHIVGLMRSQCCCVVDPNGEEMDVDLGSAKDAALFQLLNLLEEFSQQQTKIQPRLEEEQESPKIEAVDSSDAISRSSICDLLEDDEITNEGADMGIDLCGVVSPLIVDKVQFLPLPKQQEEDDELIDICGSISPVSVNKFPETPRSSSSDSSSSCSSSSDSDSSSSSSSGASSGSSCAGSSSSSDSDSDDDADSASSSPDTTTYHPTEAEVKPMEEQKVMEQDKKLITERAASPHTEMKELITERAASPHTEMQELIARAQERQKLRRELERKAARDHDRKMAREQLQEMERTAQPVFDIIDPRDMKQLGISGEAQYIVSPVKSRDSLRRRGGGLLQRLGFFLKAEF